MQTNNPQYWKAEVDYRAERLRSDLARTVRVARRRRRRLDSVHVD